ncbi:MAG: hypothetical protein IJ618_07575 [Prevotella sp.]|nr:hypothetical protein [Prevotella sp.]
MRAKVLKKGEKNEELRKFLAEAGGKGGGEPREKGFRADVKGRESQGRRFAAGGANVFSGRGKALRRAWQSLVAVAKRQTVFWLIALFKRCNHTAKILKKSVKCKFSGN